MGLTLPLCLNILAAESHLSRALIRHNLVLPQAWMVGWESIPLPSGSSVVRIGKWASDVSIRSSLPGVVPKPERFVGVLLRSGTEWTTSFAVRRVIADADHHGVMGFTAGAFTLCTLAHTLAHINLRSRQWLSLTPLSLIPLSLTPLSPLASLSFARPLRTAEQTYRGRFFRVRGNGSAAAAASYGWVPEYASSLSRKKLLRLQTSAIHDGNRDVLQGKGSAKTVAKMRRHTEFALGGASVHEHLATTIAGATCGCGSTKNVCTKCDGCDANVCRTCVEASDCCLW